MKIIAVNGSPRPKGNTAVLLQNVLAGAASLGAETELINLYDLDFKGCRSCFACKLKGGSSYGKCAAQDELSPILEKILAADALALGSPIYFGALSGEMRSFLERLLFPILAYTPDHKNLLEKKIPAAFIYTMNIKAEQMEQYNYAQPLESSANYLARFLGSCETLIVNDTLQFDDYSRYVATAFDEAHKKQVHETQFKTDCQKAFELGKYLIIQAQQ